MNERYFANRSISTDHYSSYKLQPYLKKALPVDRESRILDIGCGFGQTMAALGKEGYARVSGVDISEEAVETCARQGLQVERIADIISYAQRCDEKYDFIIMSHVLEHVSKCDIIETLRAIKEELLAEGGSLVVMVPNAQSNTGPYWAYEDFTHTTLFTSGSLFYVLKSAGFDTVEFLDPDGTEGVRLHCKLLIKTLLPLYKARVRFWNYITQSSFHRPSLQIYTYEVKAVAR